MTAADGGTYFVDNAYVCNLAAGETLPEATTTRSGMTFVGWRYASEGEIITVAKMPDVTKLDSDLYLYAEWATSGAISPDPGPNPDPGPIDPVPTAKGGVYVNNELVAELVGTDTECVATGVMLNPGDVVTIKVNGTTLTHSAGVLELWHDTYRNPHGVQFDQDAGTFTVKSAGGRRAFTIGARYYTDDTPCWSIEFSDGLTDTLVENGSYLVGSGWADGSWTIGADNYIDPAAGLTVTFTSANAEFKICEYSSASASDNRVWNHNTPSHYSMAAGSSGLNFSGISSSGNGKVTKLGTYKITVTGEGANARFVFEYLGD